MKERNLNYDLVRCLAIFFVISIHSSGLVGDEHKLGFSPAGNVLYELWQTVISTAVPLFVMLSGALLLGGKIAPPISWLKRRLHRVLVPFALWSVPLFCLSTFKEHWVVEPALAGKFLEMSLTTGVVGVYWFVYLIVGLYLVTPVIKPYFAQASRQHLAYAAALGIGFVAVSQLWSDVKWVKGFSSEYFVWFVYFVMGYVITHGLREWRHFGSASIGMLVLSLAAKVTLGTCGITDDRFLPLVQLAFNLSAFCTLLLPRLREGKAMRGVVFASKVSYGVYLSHVVFISGLCQVGFERSLPLWIEPLAMAAVVMAIEMVMMAVIRKMKMDKWLC